MWQIKHQLFHILMLHSQNYTGEPQSKEICWQVHFWTRTEANKYQVNGYVELRHKLKTYVKLLEHIGGLGFYLFKFFVVYVTKVVNMEREKIEILCYPTVPLKLKGKCY